MEIRNNMDALRTLLGVSAPAEQRVGTRNTDAPVLQLEGDKATLSSGAAAVSQSAASSDVRMEKVSAVQSALAAGTYSVPASAVAGKMMEAMLNGGSGTGSKGN